MAHIPCTCKNIGEQSSCDKPVKCYLRLMLEENDEADFQPCGECDQPDACEDFGCAIRAGVRGSMLW